MKFRHYRFFKISPKAVLYWVMSITFIICGLLACESKILDSEPKATADKNYMYKQKLHQREVSLEKINDFKRYSLKLKSIINTFKKVNNIEEKSNRWNPLDLLISLSNEVEMVIDQKLDVPSNNTYESELTLPENFSCQRLRFRFVLDDKMTIYAQDCESKDFEQLIEYTETEEKMVRINESFLKRLFKYSLDENNFQIPHCSQKIQSNEWNCKDLVINIFQEDLILIKNLNYRAQVLSGEYEIILSGSSVKSEKFYKFVQGINLE